MKMIAQKINCSGFSLVRCGGKWAAISSIDRRGEQIDHVCAGYWRFIGDANVAHLQPPTLLNRFCMFVLRVLVVPTLQKLVSE